MNPVLVELQRGGYVESQHRGAVAVLDADGAVVAALGDIDRPIFPRSAVKALQALPLVESGAADALALTDDELALACASHGGEPAHVRTAASMLAKAGADASVLECGVHWPLHDASAQALAAQRRVARRAAQQLLGQARRLRLRRVPDGARRRLARLRARLRRRAASGDARGQRRARRRHRLRPRARAARHRRLLDPHVRASRCAAWRTASRASAAASACATATRARRDGCAQRWRSAPFMVGGSGRFDTRVIERFGERVFCKVGAEGVYCAALPERGLGVAIKIDDGNNARAAEVAMAAVIECVRRSRRRRAEFVRGPERRGACATGTGSKSAGSRRPMR